MSHSTLSAEVNAVRKCQEGSGGKTRFKHLEGSQQMVGYIETILGDGPQQHSHHLLFQLGGASVRHRSPLSNSRTSA